MFDLTAAAPDPTTVDLSAAVAGIQFQARAVRVVASSAATTSLLIGGVDTTGYAAYPGIVLFGSVAVGSAAFSATGRAVLPSFGAGVTALSQTGTLHQGYVLASTDHGVFKYALHGLRHTWHLPMPTFLAVACRSIATAAHPACAAGHTVADRSPSLACAL